MGNKISGYPVSISSKKQKADQQVQNKVLGTKLSTAGFATNCCLKISNGNSWSFGKGC